MSSTLTIVAEVSANHLGSLAKAKDLVKAIAQTGSTHIKFQTYTADTMTIDCDGPAFRITKDHPLWGSRNLYHLYQEAFTPWEWHDELFELSRSLGLTPFSTPFDKTAIDFLESLEPALYKVASLEIGDIPLIRHMAGTGRSMVMSTGAATLQEIDDAVSAAFEAGCSDLTLLLCTSAYPSSPEDAHLSRMNTLREEFGLPVGISDHTVGIGVSVAAAALGAAMIERHVTKHRSEGGPDTEFSLEPDEMASLVAAATAAAAAIGTPEWQVMDSEAESRRLKRSLYIVRDCKAGEVLSSENMRSIRPSGGLAPKHFETVMGRRLVAPVVRGTPLTWDLIDWGDSPSSSSRSQRSAPTGGPQK